MPLFLFHIRRGDEVILDQEGAELPDLASVERTAVEEASELVSHAVRRGDRNYVGRLEIEDEQGGHVLTVAFSCLIEIKITAE